MRQYFNSKQTAERNLEIRRKCAYKRIDKKGWKILGDNSFVHCDYKWVMNKNSNGAFLQTTKLAWFNTPMVVTDEMLKDLTAMMSIDSQSELEAALTFSPNVFQIKKQDEHTN